MAQPIKIERHGAIALLILANPPVNAFSASLRTALAMALDKVETDPAVRAVVLIGEGRGFSAGADISEFDAPLELPSLPDLCTRIETFSKPVIAAMHGFTLAGGFEIALAAHYRVATKATRVGLPEVNIGVLPGAGGTQRLPRLVGAAAALRIMLGGAPVPVTDQDLAPLFDALAEGDLPQTAMSFANQLIQKDQGPRPTRNRRDGLADAGEYLRVIATAREANQRTAEPARTEIIRMTEMALLLPFDVAIASEWDAFHRLLETPQSRALRYLFFAERHVGKLPVPDGVELPEVDKVAVLGGGTLAMHLTVMALNAGLKTAWGTKDPSILKQGLTEMGKLYADAERRGRISAETRKRRIESLSAGQSEQVALDADAVILAAPGQVGVPIAEAAVRIHSQSEDVARLGMRFINPAYATRLVEVIAGPRVEGHELAMAQSLARSLSKLPVLVRSSGRTLTNRLFAAYYRAADALIEEGADLYEIDAAMRSWGWDRGPFGLRDSIGLDEDSHAIRAEGAANLSAVMCAAGRLGRAAGAGFYAYKSGQPVPDPEVRKIFERVQKGRSALVLSSDDIAWTLIGAIAAEAVRAIDDGMIRYASDADVALVVGYGYPRWRGGPMRAASEYGLLKLSRRMAAIEHPDRDIWQVPESWRKAMRDGRGLHELRSDVA